MRDTRFPALVYDKQHDFKIQNSVNRTPVTFRMKTITVREMKARWSLVEEQVSNGEIIEVLNRGKPRVRLVPAGGRQRVVWDDHLATAIPNKGVSATETISRDRGGRW